MKRILKSVAMILACVALTAGPVEAQGRHNGANGNRGNGNGHRTERTPSRGNSGGAGQGLRPGAGGNQQHKPAATQPAKPAQPAKPGNNGNHNGWNKPGNPHNNGGPGYGDRRPGGRPGQAPLPPRPNYGHVPPAVHGWHRPAPPAGWRPRPGAPSVGTILGLTIGTAFNATLNYLTAHNYAMTGYTPQEIVVQSVPMYGYTWPQARLLYNNGLLYGSQYVYPSPYNDLGRYNALYADFCRTYGAPARVSNGSAGLSATWYGAGQGFITLSYQGTMGQNGGVSYYTTVNVGN